MPLFAALMPRNRRLTALARGVAPSIGFEVPGPRGATLRGARGIGVAGPAGVVGLLIVRPEGMVIFGPDSSGMLLVPPPLRRRWMAPAYGTPAIFFLLLFLYDDIECSSRSHRRAMAGKCTCIYPR